MKNGHPISELRLAQNLEQNVDKIGIMNQINNHRNNLSNQQHGQIQVKHQPNMSGNNSLIENTLMSCFGELSNSKKFF